MILPIWHDEHGQRRPTRPCPKCDREEPIFRPRYQHRPRSGWKGLGTVHVIDYCGHGQDFIPVPNDEV